MRATVLASALLLLVATPALAATDAGTDSGNGATHDKPTQAQLAAGHKLADVIVTKGLAKGLVNGMVQRLIRQQADLKPYRKTIKGFYDRYASVDDLSDFMARVYATNLSVDEMNRIRAFYATPTGHKAMRMIPRTLQLAAQWSQQQLMKHRAELVRTIRKEAAARQKSNAQDKQGSAQDDGGQQ